jgi:hypothetical protein
MSTISTHERGSTPIKKQQTRRLWTALVLIVTMALATVVVVAVEAKAGSFSDEFPKMVLMKGDTRLQGGRLNYADWHWYEAGE